ncbi:MAG: hypothetical protein ACFFDT_32390 [Candidatus Hodarchaeota archaeon]
MDINRFTANFEPQEVDEGLGLKHIFLSRVDLEEIVKTTKQIEKRHNGNGYESKRYSTFLNRFVERICSECSMKDIMVEHVPISEEDKEIFLELENWLKQEKPIPLEYNGLFHRINNQIAGKF